MSRQQLMERVFVSIPDVTFHKVIKQYTFWVGIRLFTVEDYKKALMNYTHFASKNN